MSSNRKLLLFLGQENNVRKHLQRPVAKSIRLASKSEQRLQARVGVSWDTQLVPEREENL